MSWSRWLVTAISGVEAKRVDLARSSAARSSGAAVFRSMMATAGSTMAGCCSSISAMVPFSERNEKWFFSAKPACSFSISSTSCVTSRTLCCWSGLSMLLRVILP